MSIAMVSLRRSKSGLWAARKVIPADVREAYGKREEKRTWPSELSQGQAKAELAAWITPIEEKIALLRAVHSVAPLTLTKRQARSIAGEWYKQKVAIFEDDPGDPFDWWSARDELAPDDPIEAEAGRIKPTGWLIRERDQILTEKGLRLTPVSSENLLQEMGELWVALCDLMERRAQGDYSPDPVAPTLPPPETPSPVVNAVAAPVVTVTGLFDEYARTGVAAQRTLKSWERVISSFVSHLGHDNALAVARADAHSWFDSLLAQGLSARTVRMTYRAALARVFRVAHDRGRLAHNPFARLEVIGPKAVETKRKELTDEEARTILKAALGPHSEGLSEPHARARRWVPWICAYTGARVNEITQLRAMDICQIDGVWSFFITPEAGSVKTRKARAVPIHSHLIDQGILKLAKADDPTPLFYNPAAARRGSSLYPMNQQMGTKLAAWVRELGVVGVQSPNHGWRHRFKSVARRVGMDPEARDALQGHAPKTEGQAYGSWPMEALRAELEKLPRYIV
ncbi:tyrosine-type recombinase/integrase [Sphingopyxis sp. P8]|uniref:tyrosine-type recombinase/integrase n=1 Tax=Sphingopyxis sp. P8 TaxID=2763256 RepID=UPI001D09EBE9|nr:tyrosine-type recombinase/integrase [Sphingopyxis sp. P8]